MNLLQKNPPRAENVDGGKCNATVSCLQLTLLEERLEKAEAVLRRHYTDGQIAEILEGPKEGLVAQTKAPETTPAPPPEQTPLPAPPGLGSLQTTSPNNVETLLQLPDQTPDSGLYISGTQNLGTFTTDPLLLAPIGEPDATAGLWTRTPDNVFEILPSTADDFEWNEQETSRGTYDPSSWSITNHADGNPSQAIMDGMASLTIGDQKRGYYGAASGSALLRQILSARPDGEEVDADVALHEIESLFQQHSDHSQWFRSQAMLTRVAVENLIDAFFVFYHPTMPIVHEPTFRAQYAGTLPCANKGHWNTLANILAALGSFASSNVADATDLPIFQAAQKCLFSNYLEVGNLTLVQAFGLSATYMQKRNKPNTGFNYGGLAIRLAIGLGLHKDLEGNSLSPLQSETRRRIWWCLCVLDVGATITYGRPLNWPQAGVETAFPQNIHEKDLTQDSTDCPPEVDGITMYTYIRVQSAYHLSTMTVYNRLITSPFPSATELITLDDLCIGSWLAQVPYYYLAVPPPDSEHALGMGISEWRYRNLRIVMYRPFLVRWARSSTQNYQQNLTSSENLAVFRCLDAAKESITHIQGYWTSRSHSRLAAFYILYFLFHATLIPVHCLRQSPHHTLAPDWRSQIQASLTIMSAMAELNPNSSKCRDITLKLCWPHLDEEGARTYCDNTSFMTGVADSKATSIISGYNIWCESMSNAGISVPTYDWADDNDSALGFF
ncbi:Regulatory GAL4 [Fusarium albosuccineum]|uniref:Regulatory GAL4 n=1 Tax=Fusarium albosuccineum TaxID=1237068 RepID=A0A8H4L4G2_9HYPO|nr:Regulatory GAL4 [Fusarium albosuccineum]